MLPSGPRVHPAPEVLDLAELVVTGALRRLPPEAVAALLPDGPRAVVLEDAEGTPVAVVGADGTVAPGRPFAHGPLRSRRLSPADVTAAGSPAGWLAAPVSGPLSASGVARVREAAAGQGRRPLWLVLIGAGHQDGAALGPEALYRAVAEVAQEDGGLAVPVPLPAGCDALLPDVAVAYGAGGVVDPAEPGGALHPAFAPAADPGPGARRGVVVFFTGLSGSGKSTLAKALAERLLSEHARPLTMLDGDEVRRLLSHGLGFSREDRDLNVRRIAFVAAEVARHGGLAICAPIAPFAAVRAQARAMVEAAGGLFLLIHVATPLAECERRDRKGLYAAARRGEVSEFTGISSPYEEPDDADLRLDTSQVSVAECVAAVWRLLDGRGLLDRC